MHTHNRLQRLKLLQISGTEGQLYPLQLPLIQLSLPVCQEISSAYNPFSSRFPFAVAVRCCNVYSFKGLHNIPPLLPPGNHSCVQNSWHLLEYKLFKTIPTL